MCIRDSPNPIKSLLDRPETYFVTRRREAIEQLTRYLREHYGKDAKAEVVDEVPPVSYTHLDVYKRQILTRMVGSSVWAVSISK